MITFVVHLSTYPELDIAADDKEKQLRVCIVLYIYILFASISPYIVYMLHGITLVHDDIFGVFVLGQILKANKYSDPVNASKSGLDQNSILGLHFPSFNSP